MHNLITIILLASVALLATLLWQTRSELQRENERQRYATRHHRHMIGSTTVWRGAKGKPISYNLRSFDDGRSWVAVEFDDEWRMRVLGDAETVYPGLVADMQSLSALTDSVVKNGPLDLARPADRQRLKAAGFDVVPAKQSGGAL